MRGYALKGWKDISENLYGSNSVPNNNLELYTDWEAIQYPILYVLNGGEWKESITPTKTYDIEHGMSFASNMVEKTGYKFTGWSPPSIPTGSTGQKTIFANWEILKCAVKFKDGEDNTRIQNVYYGNKLG